MLVTDDVAWDAKDFAVFGAMLLAACGTFELAARTTENRAYRAAVGIAIVTAFLLVWMNLAVGIIGSEANPANLIYGGVLAVGIVGALASRCHPHGMARTLAVMALVQTAAGVFAVVARLGSTGADWPAAVVILTAFFAALWLASAWLFRRAAREEAAAGAAQ
jgi:hypothetical protein